MEECPEMMFNYANREVMCSRVPRARLTACPDQGTLKVLICYLERENKPPENQI